MVREVSVDSVTTTPIRPSRIPLGTRIPRPTSSRRDRAGGVAGPSRSHIGSNRKRAVLGEIDGTDNSMTPRNVSTSTAGPSTKRKIARPRGTPRPSRAEIPPPSSSISSSTTASPVRSSFHHPSEVDHARHEPTATFRFNFDGRQEETMLMDMEPPDLPDETSSPPIRPTPRHHAKLTGKQSGYVRTSRLGDAKMMTPVNSQETVDNTFVHPKSFDGTPRSTSRLPTPPSSDFDDDLHQQSALRNRRRSDAAQDGAGIAASSDVALEVSPNPRKKNSPRTTSATTKRSRISLASPLLTVTEPVGTPRNASRVPPTSRVSTAKPVQRTSGPAYLTPSTLGTPQIFDKRLQRAIPATAPAGNRKPRHSTTRKSPPKTASKSLQVAKRRYSTPSSRTGRRKSVTPLAMLALSGRKIGFLDKEVDVEPGEDPLLLKGPEEDEVCRWPRMSTGRKRWADIMDSSPEHGTAEAGPSQPRRGGLTDGASTEGHGERQPSKSRSPVSTQKSPGRFLEQERGDAPEAAPDFTMDFDDGGFGGDVTLDAPDGWDSDGSGDHHAMDESHVGEDTFLHVLTRNGPTATSTPKGAAPTLLEQRQRSTSGSPPSLLPREIEDRDGLDHGVNAGPQREDSPPSQPIEEESGCAVEPAATSVQEIRPVSPVEADHPDVEVGESGVGVDELTGMDQSLGSDDTVVAEHDEGSDSQSISPTDEVEPAGETSTESLETVEISIMESNTSSEVLAPKRDMEDISSPVKSPDWAGAETKNLDLKSFADLDVAEANELEGKTDTLLNSATSDVRDVHSPEPSAPEEHADIVSTPPTPLFSFKKYIAEVPRRIRSSRSSFRFELADLKDEAPNGVESQVEHNVDAFSAIEPTDKASDRSESPIGLTDEESINDSLKVDIEPDDDDLDQTRGDGPNETERPDFDDNHEVVEHQSAMDAELEEDASMEEEILNSGSLGDVEGMENDVEDGEHDAEDMEEGVSASSDGAMTADVTADGLEEDWNGSMTLSSEDHPTDGEVIEEMPLTIGDDANVDSGARETFADMDVEYQTEEVTESIDGGSAKGEMPEFDNTEADDDAGSEDGLSSGSSAGPLGGLAAGETSVHIATQSLDTSNPAQETAADDLEPEEPAITTLASPARHSLEEMSMNDIRLSPAPPPSTSPGRRAPIAREEGSAEEMSINEPTSVQGSQEQGPSMPEASTTEMPPKRICLKLINKGTVKIEPAENSSFAPAPLRIEQVRPEISTHTVDTPAKKASQPVEEPAAPIEGEETQPTIRGEIAVTAAQTGSETSVVRSSLTVEAGKSTATASDTTAFDTTVTDTSSAPAASSSSSMSTPQPRPVPPVFRFPRTNSPKGVTNSPIELMLANRVKQPSRLSQYVTASPDPSPEKGTVASASGSGALPLNATQGHQGNFPSDPVSRDVSAGDYTSALGFLPSHIGTGVPVFSSASSQPPSSSRSALGRAPSFSGPSEFSHSPRNRVTSPANLSHRSLADEIASASSPEEPSWQHEASSVVEVSSMDPRAAARAAAILKLNHAYIQHGTLPPGTPSAASIPLPLTPSTSTINEPHIRRTPRAYDSPFFESLELSRQIDPNELLHEAELEIVASRRSRSRSRSRARSIKDGYLSDETDFMVPGGWRSTPRKRKRAESTTQQVAVHPTYEDPQSVIRSAGPVVDRLWGVAEWKKLEKTYRSEKAAWHKERDVKPLPLSGSGWLGWAAKKITAFSESQRAEWDVDRVLHRFIKEEKAQGAQGEWAEDVIRLRLHALEKRVERKLATQSAAIEDEQKQSSHRDKRRKVDDADTPGMATPKHKTLTPDEVVSVVPPNTIQKLFGSFWSSSPRERTGTSDRSIDQSFDMMPGGISTGASKSTEHEQPAPASSTTAEKPITADSMRQGEPLMRQLDGPLASMSTPTKFTPAHPASPAWSPALPLPGAMPRSPRPKPTQSVQNVAIGSDDTKSKSLYPPLYPALSKRSEPVRQLFETPTSSSLKRGNAAPVPISIPKGRIPSPSVRELARSFEEEGTLSNMYKEKGKGRASVGSGGLRRVQSREL